MKMEKLVRNKLDSLLDPSFSEMGKGVKEFIHGYASQWDPASTASAGNSLNIQGMILSLAEEFNQSLHRYLADQVNTEIARQAQALVQLVQHATDLFIHCLDHGSVDGVTLTDANAAFLLGRPDLFFRAKLRFVVS